MGPAVCIKLMVMVKGEIPPPKGGWVDEWSYAPR
eukprot:SAG25_NODE_9104_length_387_cov_8.107639_1_plen_33_part_10